MSAAEGEGQDNEASLDGGGIVGASATRLDFINQTGSSVDIFWVDTASESRSDLVFYARMRTGDNWSCDTHIGHEWVACIADTSEEIGRWLASRSLPLVVLLPKSKDTVMSDGVGRKDHESS